MYILFYFVTKVLVKFLDDNSFTIFSTCYRNAESCVLRFDSDIYDDLISRRVNSSDAEKFAQLCPCPCNGVMWGVIWSVIIFNAFYLCFSHLSSFFLFSLRVSLNLWSNNVSNGWVKEDVGQVSLKRISTRYLSVERLLFPFTNTNVHVSGSFPISMMITQILLFTLKRI